MVLRAQILLALFLCYISTPKLRMCVCACASLRGSSMGMSYDLMLGQSAFSQPKTGICALNVCGTRNFVMFKTCRLNILCVQCNTHACGFNASQCVCPCAQCNPTCVWIQCKPVSVCPMQSDVCVLQASVCARVSVQCNPMCGGSMQACACVRSMQPFLSLAVTLERLQPQSRGGPPPAAEQAPLPFPEGPAFPPPLFVPATQSRALPGVPPPPPPPPLMTAQSRIRLDWPGRYVSGPGRSSQQRKDSGARPGQQQRQR